MSVFDRIMNLTRATANEMLNKLENPVLMMNQYIRSMEEEIDSMQGELNGQQAATRAHQQRLDECQQLVRHNQLKAEEALVEGREAEARLALEKRLRYEEQAADYERLYELARHSAAQIEPRLDNAREELARLLQKRADLSERIQKAEAASQRTAPSFSHGFEPGIASRGFDRVEEKILQWEAQLGLSREYKPSGAAYTDADAGVSPVEDSRATMINEQLAELRRKMKGE